ncbi:hypothetical protein Tco_0016070 [Tanacetum coccineum]
MDVVKLTAEFLVGKLAMGSVDVQRQATYELRLLAKTGMDNKMIILEAGTVLNKPCLEMITYNSYERQDFVSIDDLKELNNELLYTIQNISFKRHQGPSLTEYAKTFSLYLLIEVDTINLDPNVQMRVIEGIRNIPNVSKKKLLCSFTADFKLRKVQLKHVQLKNTSAKEKSTEDSSVLTLSEFLRRSKDIFTLADEAVSS